MHQKQKQHQLFDTLTGALEDGYFKVRIFVPPLMGGALGGYSVFA